MNSDKNGPPYMLSNEMYNIIADIAATIVPSGDDPVNEPGAREVGTINYIDSALLGAEDKEIEMLQNVLSVIRQKAEEYGNSDFISLPVSEKVKILKSLFEKSETKDAYLFLRSLCVEGFYSDYHDPGYNGVTAWDLIEFGGPRISDLKKDWSFLKVYSARSQPEGEKS